MKKKHLILILAAIVFFSIVDMPWVLTRALSSGRATISIVSDKNGEYRFLSFKLTPDNTVFDIQPDILPGFLSFLMKKGNRGDFLDGYFVIHIPRNKFPIQSLSSPAYISVIMPQTNSDNPQKDKLIAEKKALFDRIVNMVNSGTGEVDIVIDLNRGVLLKNNDPASLKIESSQVFFRNVNGKYINHPGLYNE